MSVELFFDKRPFVNLLNGTSPRIQNRKPLVPRGLVKFIISSITATPQRSPFTAARTASKLLRDTEINFQNQKVSGDQDSLVEF